MYFVLDGVVFVEVNDLGLFLGGVEYNKRFMDLLVVCYVGG